MHGGVLVYARPLHKVLSLGHVWLLFFVCACWGNTGLVRREGGLWISGHLTPSPDVMCLRSPGPRSRGTYRAHGPIGAGGLFFPLR